MIIHIQIVSVPRRRHILSSIKKVGLKIQIYFL